MSHQAQAPRPTHRVVAGLVRRPGEILLVSQQGPGDATPSWFIPGGVVEPGELLPEALAREVLEETGLRIVEFGLLAYLIQVDNRAPQRLLEGLGTGVGYESTAHIFEVAEWEGEIGPADPDRYVCQARFLPLAAALGKLTEHPIGFMREPLVAYLSGAAAPAAVWLYRRDTDGSDHLVARLPGSVG